jgi:VWFA-related protein
MRTIVLAIIGLLWQAPTFRSSIERVPLDVSVTAGGRPVIGLTAADFILTDNGAAQVLESVSQQEDSALCVQLVLDLSGSVSGQRLGRLVDASTALVDALRPSDRAGLVTFATSVDVRVPMTQDRERVKQSLSSTQGAGTTSLRDAVEVALGMAPCEAGRPLMIVFSDGVDTSSWLSDGEVVESARRSDVVIHVVAVRAPTLPSRFLPDLANAAGGRVFSATSPDDLMRLFTSALSEMRARYLVTFTPRAATPGWHELKIRVRGRSADTKARPGYFVNATK